MVASGADLRLPIHRFYTSFPNYGTGDERVPAIRSAGESREGRTGMRLLRQGIKAHGGTEPDDMRPSSGRPIDLVHLAHQTLGDRELEREILGLMARQLEQCSIRFDLATDGERSALAHAVKGAARNIGAFALANSAQGVEDRPSDQAARASMMKEMSRADGFIRSLLG